jgi:hypothetical protein
MGPDDELAAIAGAPTVAEIRDLKAVQVRLFMSYLNAAGRRPFTVNKHADGRALTPGRGLLVRHPGRVQGLLTVIVT